MEEREGKWEVKMGLQRWSEDMETDQDLQTQEAMARAFRSRYCETKTRTSHGGEEQEEEEEDAIAIVLVSLEFFFKKKAVNMGFSFFYLGLKKRGVKIINVGFLWGVQMWRLNTVGFTERGDTC